jgi:hypothetical protein
MLSQGELVLLFGAIRFACTFFVIPSDFSYNKVKMDLHLRPTLSRLKALFCKAALLNSILYMGFTAFRLYEIYRWKGGVGDLVYCFVFLLLRAANSLLTLTVFKSPEDLLVLLNRQISLNSNLCKYRITLR